MLEIIVLAIMSWSAIRASSRLRKSKSLFSEFGASMAVAYLAWLYPLAPVLFFLLSVRLGLVPAGFLALLCYVPGMVALKSAIRIFECSGTNRTKAVQDELSLLFIVGLGGVVYVVASVSIRLLLTVSSPIG